MAKGKGGGDYGMITATHGTRLTALPFQREGVLTIEQKFNGRALLADDMGLGKTLQGLWWLGRGRAAAWPAVVACPAPVKYQWERMAAQQLGLRADVCEGRRPPPWGGVYRPARLVICNYEILPDWAGWLQQYNPQSIIIDECQNICNPEAQRTMAIRDLCRPVPYVLGMSGTPLVNRPSELWVMLNILLPHKYNSFLTYAMEYCRPRKVYGKWQYHGARNTDKLHAELLEDCMIRRTKEEVLDQLPAKMRSVVPVQLSDPGEYDRAKNDFRGWLLERRGKDHAVRASYAEKLTQISHLLSLIGRLKMRGLDRWLQNFLETTDEKLVVFCTHTKMIEAFHKRYAKQSVMVYGGVTGRHRQGAIDTFIHDKKCRIVFANIKAGGTGIDGLQRVCRHVAFFELDWVPGRHIQAEDRIYRIGQEWPIWVYYLVAGGTLEDTLSRVLQEKAFTLAEVLDGSVDEARELSLMDMLMAAVGEELQIW